MTRTMTTVAASVTLLALVAGVPRLLAQAKAVISGPVGPSPYDVVRGWHKPFSQPGFAFGGNSGVFAESPNRILVAQRGEFRIPDPIPAGFAGYAGSIGFNVLTAADRRVWRNCLYILDGEGNVTQRWTQWDHLCEGSTGPGPHRLRISSYDPERRVWVVNETFHQIYVFSNDGSKLLKTLGEKSVPGSDATHFARPQDVAFLPDGRILIADGLDNHRVMILDRELNYLSEFGGLGNGPGQFNGVHALAVGPRGLIFALDRSGGRINVFRTTPDPAKVELVDAWPGLQLPLDIIVNDEAIWVTDLGPLRFVKLDLKGNHLYTWMVPRDLPDGYLEVHTFTVDANDESLRRRQPVRPHAEVRAQAWRRPGAAHWPAVGWPPAWLKHGVGFKCSPSCGGPPRPPPPTTTAPARCATIVVAAVVPSTRSFRRPFVNILEAIVNAQGGGAVQQIGKQFGLGEDQTIGALSALVPALAGGFQRNASTADGLGSLMAALTNGNHSQYLDNPSVLGNAAAATDGNGILGHILGSKDVSRNVAAQAAAQTGIAPGILKQMLPIVASLMMGALARQGAGAGAALAPAGMNEAGGGGLLSMLTPLLDKDRDGSVVDDVLGMLGRIGQK